MLKEIIIACVLFITIANAYPADNSDLQSHDDQPLEIFDVAESKYGGGHNNGGHHGGGHHGGGHHGGGHHGGGGYHGGGKHYGRRNYHHG